MTRRRPYKMRTRFWSGDPWRTTAYAHSSARNHDAHGYADAGWDVEIWNGDAPKDVLPAAPNALRERKEAEAIGSLCHG